MADCYFHGHTGAGGMCPECQKSKNRSRGDELLREEREKKKKKNKNSNS